MINETYSSELLVEANNCSDVKSMKVIKLSGMWFQTFRQ